MKFAATLNYGIHNWKYYTRRMECIVGLASFLGFTSETYHIDLVYFPMNPLKWCSSYNIITILQHGTIEWDSMTSADILLQMQILGEVSHLQLHYILICSIPVGSRYI